MNKVLVVGGVPQPIGGVTNFIFRLAESNLVSSIADIYPSEFKDVPVSYNGRYQVFRGFFHFFLSFCFFRSVVEGIEIVHFNFSKPISLILPFFLPKRKKIFALMLHHGELISPYPKFITKLFLGAFDQIYVLSCSQEEFYDDHGVSKENIIHSSSYIPASIPSSDYINEEVAEFIERMADNGYCVISGYGNEIYNHHWVVDLFSEVEFDLGLMVFIYGGFEGEYFEALRRKVSDNPRVKIFCKIDSQSFNYALSRSSCYLRPNHIDSFGIAVADAISYSVPVLASDVCERYPGAHLFKISSYNSFVEDYLKFRCEPHKLEVANQAHADKVFKYIYEDSL